jgi:hypothetical protein
LENKLRAITPELMAASAPNFNHRYIRLVRIFYRMPAWVSTQEVCTMTLAISFFEKMLMRTQLIWYHWKALSATEWYKETLNILSLNVRIHF